MAKTKIELISAGVRAMLRSTEMQSLLAERASEIANAAGDGYETDIYVGRNRANAGVFASTDEAMRDNLKNNSLLKAVR